MSGSFDVATAPPARSGGVLAKLERLAVELSPPARSVRVDQALDVMAAFDEYDASRAEQIRRRLATWLPSALEMLERFGLRLRAALEYVGRQSIEHVPWHAALRLLVAAVQPSAPPRLGAAA